MTDAEKVKGILDAFDFDTFDWVSYKEDSGVLEALQSFLPRHMPEYDWNKPWAVGITLMIKELLANRDTHYQSKLALMERIREYADHKWDCSVKHNQGCSCGWVELRDALHKLDEAGT